MWIVAIFIIRLLGTAATNTVDVRTADYRCQTWGSYMRVLEKCGSDSTYGVGPINEEFITVETMNSTVFETCVPTLLTYKTCVLKMTDACEAADHTLILNEMDAYYNRCRATSWIFQYALKGYDKVDRSCIDTNGICASESVRYAFPDSNTPLAEALLFMRGKTSILFDCIKTHTIDVLSKLPGCTSTWEDIFFTLLIGFTNLPRVGIRMHPEQIEKIKVNIASVMGGCHI